jgi:hypothetical protein
MVIRMVQPGEAASLAEQMTRAMSNAAMYAAADVGPYLGYLG